MWEFKVRELLVLLFMLNLSFVDFFCRSAAALEPSAAHCKMKLCEGQLRREQVSPSEKLFFADS